MAKATYCNLCGKKFDEWDKQEDFSIHRNLGYGTKYDSDILDLDLCCDCMEKFLDDIIPRCQISPIAESNAF